MGVIERFKELGLKKVLLIDDAFAAPTPGNIAGESVTLLNEALLDDPDRTAQIEKKFRRTLDPRRPELSDAALQDSEFLMGLWKIRAEKDWNWLSSTLFGSYEEELRPKIEALKPITDYFNGTEIVLSPYGTFDLARDQIAAADVVLLDFFLKGETQPDNALTRASDLARVLSDSRTARGTTPLRYPLVVLFSTRPEAARRADEFKRLSMLRGCFFQFLPKAELAQEKIERCLTGLVSDYERNQGLARILDEYWLAAHRVADKVKVCVQSLEPNDIALLHAAALIAEKEKFNHYLTWLIGLYASTMLACDSKLKAVSGGLIELGSALPLPGHIPASQMLSDLFIAATARSDVSDDFEDAKEYDITLGDVFVRGDIGKVSEAPEQLLVVIDQSCDLKHASEKKRVLCLRGFACQEIKQMAAIYEAEKWPTYFIGLKLPSKDALFRITWNVIDAETVNREVLEERQGLKRVARLQDLIAVQLQERYLQNLGRIGTAAQPPLVGAYSARLRLGKSKMEFDARDNSWAAVTVVWGRVPKRKSPDGAEGGVIATKKTRGGDPANESEMLLELWFCREFVEWLKEKLPVEFDRDATLRNATVSLRRTFEQAGSPRGKLKPAKEPGVHWLALGEPVDLRIMVVQTDEQFGASKENAVLQIVPYTVKP